MSKKEPLVRPSRRAPRWFLAAALLGATTLAGTPRAAPASADRHAVEGTVLSLEPGVVIIDVAASQGASTGDLVELWRPIALRHPVTGRTLKDRFLLGQLRLLAVSAQLAKAKPEGTLEQEPAVGDIVILKRTPAPSDAASLPVPGPEVAPSSGGRAAAPIASGVAPVEVQPANALTVEPPQIAPTPPPVDSEAAEVAEMFESLRGASLARRIKAYEAWSRYRPHSKYAATLHEEAVALRALIVKQREDRDDSAKAQDAVSVSHLPAEEALVAQPLTLALRAMGAPRALLIHYRTQGEPSFRSHVLASIGPGYYSITIAGSQLRRPALEYFFEGTSQDGTTQTLLGSAHHPLRIEVREPPSYERAKPSRGTVALWTDYADYNRLRGNDAAWQTEGWLGMRFDELGVRAVRSGFGVLRGVGGSLEELDELDLSPRSVGLTYGYLEGEFGIHDLFSILGRPVVGLKDGGITGGAQLVFRIGNDLRTNLQLGGEVLGGVGLRSFAELQLEELEDWPLLFRCEVTNQPAGSSASLTDVRPDDEDVGPEATSLAVNDVGVRGIVQAGYRILDALVVSARVSYQGRNIQHSGPGFGGGVSYSW